MTVSITLKQYLANKGAEYDVVSHPHTMSASRTAQQSHVSGDRMAKAVVVKDKEGFALAVLPASRHVAIEALRDCLNRAVDLASEAEVATLFKDCELGAVPALGQAYGLKVVVDDSLEKEPEVYFEGGDHASLVHMRGEAFRRLMAGAMRGRFAQ